MPDSRRFFARINAGRVLGGMALLLLPVALFASKGLAPLFVVTAVLVFARTFDLGRLRSILMRPVTLGLAAFLVFAAASAPWSIEPAYSLRTVLALALTFFGGLYLADAGARLGEAEREIFYTGIIVGGLLGVSLFVFERATGALLTREILTARGIEIDPAKNYMDGLNAGMSVFALYVWPWAVAAKRRLGTPMMALGLLVSVVLVSLSGADAPVAALLAGLVVAALCLLSRRVVLGLFAAASVVVVVALPLLSGALPDPKTETRAYSLLSHSAVSRLVIWRTAAGLIAEAPVAGIGINGTRFLYDDSDVVFTTYKSDDPTKTWGSSAEPIPLHAHNGILQIWLELGAIGAAFFIGVLLAVMWRIRQGFDDILATAARLGVLTSGLVIFSISFGPWQSWWQAGMWLTVALISVSGATTKDSGPCKN